MKDFIMWGLEWIKDRFLAVVLILVMCFGFMGVCGQLKSISSAIYSHEEAVYELTMEIGSMPDYVLDRLDEKLPALFWRSE